MSIHMTVMIAFCPECSQNYESPINVLASIHRHEITAERNGKIFSDNVIDVTSHFVLW